MNKKIILAGLLSLASVASVVGTVGNAHEVDAATPATLYLVPNSNWTQANARFAAYFFGNGEKWVSMTDEDGDSIYEVTVPSGFPKVIFCRMNPSASANNWDNKWNQTGDLTIPTDGKNQFTLSGSTWNGATTTWGTYTAPDFYMAGTMNSWNTTADKFTNSNGVYTLSLELEAGDYSFKVVKNGAWDQGSFGYGDITVNGITTTKDAGSSGNDNNIKFTAESGTYTFTYSKKVLDVSFVPAANPTEEVNELLNEYYNNGTYTRATVINLSNVAKDELAKYWHAGSNLLERTTYFKGGELWMTNDKGEYSYYGTKDSDTVYASTQTHSETPENTYVAIKGKTMEEYYTTMKDIKENAATWTKKGNVYSTNDERVIKMFLDFTAPCLYDVTEDNANYLSYNGVEVEKTGNGLELRLKVSNIDAGKLATENGILSTATITYVA